MLVKYRAWVAECGFVVNAFLRDVLHNTDDGPREREA